MKIQVKQSVDKALQALNKQQREVISLRFGLDDGKKWVLQEIANEYKLTRERIRQIQNTALRQLRKDPCVQSLSEVISHLEDALQQCGGASSEERLCLSCDAATKTEKNYVHLLLTIADQFSHASDDNDVEKYWYLDDESKTKVSEILKHLHDEVGKSEGKIFREEEIAELLANAPHQCPEDYTVITDLSKKVNKNYRNEWGARNHPEIALNTLAGYITVVLRTEGKPLHFTEISQKISEAKGSPCHQESCHNELVRRKEFILVGRGMYALEGMGYRSGTVAEIIAAILQEKGPMTQPIIIENVKKERLVKDQSIISVLNNNKQFAKNENKEYVLVEVRETGV